MIPETNALPASGFELDGETIKGSGQFVELQQFMRVEAVYATVDAVMQED